jgi:hypothetical protein
LPADPLPLRVGHRHVHARRAQRQADVGEQRVAVRLKIGNELLHGRLELLLQVALGEHVRAELRFDVSLRRGRVRVVVPPAVPRVLGHAPDDAEPRAPARHVVGEARDAVAVPVEPLAELRHRALGRVALAQETPVELRDDLPEVNVQHLTPPLGGERVLRGF